MYTIEYTTQLFAKVGAVPWRMRACLLTKVQMVGWFSNHFQFPMSILMKNATKFQNLIQGVLLRLFFETLEKPLCKQKTV